MITLTEEAAHAARRMMADQDLNAGETGIRMSVKPSGCSGYSYHLDFENSPSEGDEVVEQHGLRIFVDPQSLPMLRGMEVDWKGGLLGAGFKFRNPMAQRTCGCGESFSLDPTSPSR